ncbi:MAG: DUF4266 domain-containing protein [Methylococcales bacterium]|nr:DUF4266 domain-containing protein [Methylococcales bacterium]
MYFRLKPESLWPVLALCAVVTSGCAEVAPWERGRLAKPQMAPTPHPVQKTIRSHNYSSREAGAPDPSGSGGGGCGCY